MLIKSRKGFTLLEVLVATVLVGVGIFAIMEAFNRGYLGVGQAEDYSVALSLSEEKMEELRDAPYNNISNSKKAVVSGFPSFQREVIVTQPISNLKQIVVKTYWTVPNGEDNVSLTTFKLNNEEAVGGGGGGGGQRCLSGGCGGPARFSLGEI